FKCSPIHSPRSRPTTPTSVRTTTIFAIPAAKQLLKQNQQSKSEDAMTLLPHVHADDLYADLSPNERPRRRTILLVEDEPFVREATCSILENAGFEVLPAEDARAAMKIYDECKRRIDLVMTDMVLPGGTGLQLGQDLRQRSPEVVVLVTSGYGNPEYE